jgi:hypothetical protein
MARNVEFEHGERSWANVKSGSTWQVASESKHSFLREYDSAKQDDKV